MVIEFGKLAFSDVSTFATQGIIQGTNIIIQGLVSVCGVKDTYLALNVYSLFMKTRHKTLKFIKQFKFRALIHLV